MTLLPYPVLHLPADLIHSLPALGNVLLRRSQDKLSMLQLCLALRQNALQRADLAFPLLLLVAQSAALKLGLGAG